MAFHISANDPFHESEGAIISFLPRKFEGLVIDLGGPNTKSLFNKKKKNVKRTTQNETENQLQTARLNSWICRVLDSTIAVLDIHNLTLSMICFRNLANSGSDEVTAHRHRGQVKPLYTGTLGAGSPARGPGNKQFRFSVRKPRQSLVEHSARPYLTTCGRGRRSSCANSSHWLTPPNGQFLQLHRLPNAYTRHLAGG